MATYQEQTWSFLKSKGLPDKSCAAVMGNIQAESGFDPTQIESGNGIGFGLCQWSYDRRAQLESYGTDFQHQLNFLWSELTGADLDITGASYQWINQDGYLNHADFMTGNGTINDLTASFCFSWERPNVLYAHLDVRQQSANDYYTQFSETTPDPTTGTHCKLIYPFWFGSKVKISYSVNDFILLSSTGNVVLIKNELSNRQYYVNKSSIKIV
jgi:hypothetical protein